MPGNESTTEQSQDEHKQNEKPKFQSSILDFDSPMPNALYFAMKEGYRPIFQSKTGLILLNITGIEHIGVRSFNIKGTFLQTDGKKIQTQARASDIDGFLMIGPLSDATDASTDDTDIIHKLMDILGDIKIDNLNYLKFKQNDLVKYKPMQKYKHKKPINNNIRDMKVIETYPHRYLGDLGVEYKLVENNNNDDNNSINAHYCCHESLLRPNSFEESPTDAFDTTYDAILLYELRRAMEMNKTRLFDLCKIEDLPFPYNIESPFFNKFLEYEWLLDNPLSNDTIITLNSIFNLLFKRIIKNILINMEPSTHENIESIQISSNHSKLKYGTSIEALLMHCKMTELFDSDLGQCITRSHASIWFTIENETQLNKFGLKKNDLSLVQETGDKIELLLNNKLQFKWNRQSIIFFIEKFDYQTFVSFE